MENRIKSSDINERDLRLDEAIVVTDADGYIYWSNRAFRQLCGYSKREVFGRRPDEFLQGESTDPKTLRAIRAAIRKGESLSVEVLNYHKKGKPYWVAIELTPTKANDGRLTGFVAMEHDVTEAHGEAIAF